MTTPEDFLFKTFGFKEFRNQQKDIIEAVVNQRRDVCAVMATGHGKSICYQLPAIMTQKVSIIISPLLSLMEDQRINLEKVGVKACCFNSTLKNKSQTENEILNGEYIIIYMTPESVVSENSKKLLQNLNKSQGIGLIAIDEAHCVSLWGNSFRSSYLELSCLRRWLPDVPILALTGTATPKVQEDMIRLLNLNNPLKIRTTADRPNLSYFVHPKTTPENDLKNVGSQTTIIYCPKRKDTEKITEILVANGVSCESYHAGLATEIKNEIHQSFMDGTCTCIVATIAFGMGIDKNNIRKVIHYGCPKDIESYVQETGRAGRDGNLSECHVYFSQTDFAINRFFLKDINDQGLRIYKENMIHAVEKYLYVQSCRRQFILDYFGDKIVNQNPVCCDRCQSTSQTIITNVGPEVRNYLELVDDFSGKFGKLMYINVIRGANLAKMPDYFKKSKYYGIGTSKTIDWWKLCVQHLFNEGLIEEKSSSGSYGTKISVSRLGTEWLNNNVFNPVFLITENSKNSILSPQPNRLTRQINDSNLSIDSILKSTSNITLNETTQSKSKSSESGASGFSTLNQTQQTSYNLFHNDNNTIENIAKTRQLSITTIEGHLVEAVKALLPISLQRLGLSKDKYHEIYQLIDGEQLNGDVSRLAPIKILCSPDTTYLQIKLVIALGRTPNPLYEF